MPIFLNNSGISAIKLGESNVSKIFLGNEQVFPGFGSSGFQWMTINSVTSSTASGIGQNSITVSITQDGGGMFQHDGMYAATNFPEEYGVPLIGTTQIGNTQSGVFTAVFSQPVNDALVAFASVGQGGTPVPVQVSAPFTPIWGTSTTYQNPVNATQYSQFTGEEGYNIIRIDGSVTTITFNYTVSENYCTVCFGFVDQNTTTGSLVFGADEKYISFAGDNDWALGTGDFCIEWWQYQTAASPPLYSRFFQVGDYPNHSIAVSIENGTFILWVNNENTYYPVSLENYLNQWVHFAVVRQSGTSSVYQNGSRILNVSTPNNVTNNTDPLKIGSGSSQWWNGRITNFRWVKGSSVYDGTQNSITAPTAPLAAISGTKLLLLTNSAGTYLDDSSGLNKSATNNGGVTWFSDAPDFT